MAGDWMNGRQFAFAKASRAETRTQRASPKSTKCSCIDRKTTLHVVHLDLLEIQNSLQLAACLTCGCQLFIPQSAASIILIWSQRKLAHSELLRGWNPEKPKLLPTPAVFSC